LLVLSFLLGIDVGKRGRHTFVDELLQRHVCRPLAGGAGCVEELPALAEVIMLRGKW
jgi:hypothetical protein